MIEKHILNIGPPRSGTTFIWENLCHQSWFHHIASDKENYLLLENGCDIDNYCNFYNQYQISGNFSPTMVYFDRYLIQALRKIPNVCISVIIRDPISWTISQLQFTNTKIGDFNKALQHLKTLHLAKFINRWKQEFGEVNIFFFEDLVKDSSKFFTDYCQKMNLPDVEIFIETEMKPGDSTTELSTSRCRSIPNSTYQEVSISPASKKLLIQYISDLEELTNRSLYHWKSNILELGKY